MRLHYADVLNPRKACALAKHLGAPVDYVKVDLARRENKTPAFRALNPTGRVPVLEDGDTIVWETDAILCHLALRMGSDLWPRDARQVEVIRWLSWNQAHFNPCAGLLYFENVIKAKFNVGPPDAAAVGGATKAFHACAEVLDAHLADRDFLAGTLTIADFSLGAPLPYAAAAALPLADYPAIRGWQARLDALPAWRDPYPD